MDAEQIVTAFTRAFASGDLEAALELVSDDVYYDNVPIGDMRGKAAMREFLAPMMGGPVEFVVHRQVTAGNVVFNERTDNLVVNGKPISLPVAGVFEVNDGLITFWRDYFDNGTFLKQLKG